MKKTINLYLTIGLIGSGKSTWSNKKVLEEEKCVIINRDSFRSMIKGGYAYSPELENLVKDMSNSSLHHALINGYDVIIDETNITRYKRGQWISMANHLKLNDQELRVTYVWCVEEDNNVKLRMNDPRGISQEQWQKVYDGMKKNFQAPDSIDEEGIYDDLIKVKI